MFCFSYFLNDLIDNLVQNTNSKSALGFYNTMNDSNVTTKGRRNWIENALQSGTFTTHEMVECQLTVTLISCKRIIINSKKTTKNF